jgi:cytochrome c556
MNFRVTALATALALAGVSTAALAQVKPEDAIRARQSIMRVVALNFGPLANMAQDKEPFNKDLFTANAARLESLWAMNPSKFFIAGTDKPVQGAKIASFTDAKPEVWGQADKFKSAYDKAGQEIAKLSQAARSGDEKTMKAAAGEVGKSCKGCHDDFRAK